MLGKKRREGKASVMKGAMMGRPVPRWFGGVRGEGGIWNRREGRLYGKGWKG